MKRAPDWALLLRQIKRRGGFGTWRQVAEAAGIDPAVVARLQSGEQKTLLWQFGDAIIRLHAKVSA